MWGIFSIKNIKTRDGRVRVSERKIEFSLYFWQWMRRKEKGSYIMMSSRDIVKSILLLFFPLSISIGMNQNKYIDYFIYMYFSIFLPFLSRFTYISCCIAFPHAMSFRLATISYWHSRSLCFMIGKIIHWDFFSFFLPFFYFLLLFVGGARLS